MFILLDTVKFSAGDWENRNRIKTPAGSTWLTVPIAQPHTATCKDVTIAHQHWRRKHQATIVQAYCKAPYFELYSELLNFYGQPWLHLAALNEAMLLWFCDRLNITTPMVRASDLNCTGTGSTLLVNLCQAVGATIYWSGAPGRNYLDARQFEAVNIQIEFQDFVHPVYPQLHGAFVPGLAIIDALFNCGEATKIYANSSDRSPSRR